MLHGFSTQRGDKSVLGEMLGVRWPDQMVVLQGGI